MTPFPRSVFAWGYRTMKPPRASTTFEAACVVRMSSGFNTDTESEDQEGCSVRRKNRAQDGYLPKSNFLDVG